MISKTARRYGFYEARMQTPPGAGWHSSFWMMKHDGSGGIVPDRFGQMVEVDGLVSEFDHAQPPLTGGKQAIVSC